MANARPLSQLIHFPVQEGGDGAPVITMHDAPQFALDVADWGTAASPDGRVIALESYKGIFVGKEIEGYAWFLGPDEVPSPIFFGDSLAEIERFLWDEIDPATTAQPALPWIVGVGQGGIMALATALAVPELISGVIAVNAFLPKVGGWDPPLAPLNQLPILLVNPKSSSHPRVLEGDILEKQLSDWGAHAEIWRGDLNIQHTDVLSGWISKHGVRQLDETDH